MLQKKPAITGILLLSLLIIAGCSSSHTTTIWKNEHAFPGKYNKIMIAAITSTNDTGLRSTIENNFKQTLQLAGYKAVSSLKEFGISGLRDLGQEDTYRNLCDKGIDAVMILSLTDRRNENYKEPVSAYADPVKYYYKKIWHYKEREPGFTAAFYDSSRKYSWEMILFDLSTLQPHSIIQSRVYTNGIDESINKEFWKDITRRLIKDRFLKKKEPVTDSLKAF